MMTVKEVSELTGISIMTLQYYDRIGLLHTAAHTDDGHRLYDKNALLRLQEILLFRELELPLKDIMVIMNDPRHDKQKTLQEHISLLELKKQHIDGLISLAKNLLGNEEKELDLSAFNTQKIEDYKKQAQAKWGNTDEYKEFSEKDKDRSDEQRNRINEGLMDIFVRFGKIKHLTVDNEQVQALVKELQDYISENFYNCSDDVLASLGQLYGSGGEFTENINKNAGEGTAEFASLAIEAYTKNKAE